MKCEIKLIENYIEVWYVIGLFIILIVVVIIFRIKW